MKAADIKVRALRVFITLFFLNSMVLTPLTSRARSEVTTPKPTTSGCTVMSAHSISRLLRDIISTLPHAIPQKSIQYIMQSPVEFLCDAQTVLKNTSADILLLVDKHHSIGNYTPSDLVSLDMYRNTLILNKRGLQFRKVALKSLLAMVKDAAKEGITLLISSTYRSYEYQQEVFARNVKALGHKQASRESARAGTSQHQLGLTIDFGCICPEFENTSASNWLKKQAWKYGFSLSFPPEQEHITGYIFESWHYRYIGKAAATFEKKYFAQGQQHVLELLQNRTKLLNL